MTLLYSQSIKNKDGKSEIFCRLCLPKVNLRAKTGIFIAPSNFEYEIRGQRGNYATREEAEKKGYVLTENGRIKPLHGKKVISSADKAEYMNAINKLQDFTKYITFLVNTTPKGDINKGWFSFIVDRFLYPDKYHATTQNKDVYTLFNEWTNDTQKDFSVYRKRGCAVLARLVARYEKFIQLTHDDKFTFDYNTVNRDVIEGIRDYIRNEKQLSEEYPQVFAKIISINPTTIAERGENTIVDLMKRLKAFFSWLYDNGHTKNRPFEGVKVGCEQYGEPIYITEEERRVIASTPMRTKHLEAQRDIFIFQCLVGCRVGDLYTLTTANVISGCLEYTPHKTHKEGQQVTTVSVPLVKSAITLIDKYKGIDSKGRLFPFITQQRYNDAIKDIFRACGIDRLVQTRNALTGEMELKPICDIASSHMARRTFAGNIYNKVQDPNIICSMTGHVEGSRAFARYRKIEQETKINTLKKVFE